MTPTTARPGAPSITPAQRRQYQEEGYVILPAAIPPDLLDLLRTECAAAIGRADREMARTGKPLNAITHAGKRYFINNRYREGERLWRFLFSELMADVCRALLDEKQAWLFHEQWVVKNAEVGMKFAWHQDSGYLGFPHRPYLSCWCPLDDVSEENGTIYVLPHARGGTREHLITHVKEQGSNDLVGYSGSDQGVAVAVPAGSIVAFTSYTLHRSGPNRTPRDRRVYLAQYSAHPIFRPGTAEPWALATPFLRDGANIYDPKSDLAPQAP